MTIAHSLRNALIVGISSGLLLFPLSLRARPLNLQAPVTVQPFVESQSDDESQQEKEQAAKAKPTEFGTEPVVRSEGDQP